MWKYKITLTASLLNPFRLNSPSAIWKSRESKATSPHRYKQHYWAFYSLHRSTHDNIWTTCTCVSCKTLTAFPHEAKAGLTRVENSDAVLLSTVCPSASCWSFKLEKWKSLQLCINSLTWISLLRLSGENQSSSRGVCVSSHPCFLHVRFLCVCRPLQLVLEHEHGSWSLRLGSAEEVDKVIAHIGSCLHRICPAGVPV